MAIATAEDVSALCDTTAKAQDRVIELEKVLTGIATLWPEPGYCPPLDESGVHGINDGKQRAIIAHAAVNAARKVLGLPLA